MKANFLISLAIFSLSHLAMAESKLSPEEQAETVMAHNHWRNAVKAPELQWSTELADIAQDYADTLKARDTCELRHSQSTDLGENLFWASPIISSNGGTNVQHLSPTHVIGDWVSEKKDYRYAINSCVAGKICGHYTQIVWESTTEVGCGKAICSDKSQVWVCNYKPAGNFVGQKPY